MEFASLIYVHDSAGRWLLMRREKEPNLGLWTPVGGHYEAKLRETVHESAARELREELLLAASPSGLRLRGIACERGSTPDGGGHADWMLFICSILLEPAAVPARGPEGELRWFTREEIRSLAIPETDRDILWPIIWENGPFFAVSMEWDGRAVTGWKREQ